MQFPSCPFTGARISHCDFLFFSAFPPIYLLIVFFTLSESNSLLFSLFASDQDPSGPVLTFGTSIREPSSSRFSYLRLLAIRTPLIPRSEERRVGKEGRSRWSPYH